MVYQWHFQKLFYMFFIKYIPFIVYTKMQLLRWLIFFEAKKEIQLSKSFTNFNLNSKSSGNVCCLGHFFIGSIEIQKNPYLQTFYFIFDLLLRSDHVNLY